MTKEYRLEGLTCANCAAKFEKNILHIKTVETAQVNFAASKVMVKGTITEDQLDAAGAFDNITVLREQQEADAPVPLWKRPHNVKLMIAFLLLVAGLSFQPAFGKDHMLVYGLLLAAILVGGYDLFIAGFKNLISFYFDMKTLMTIAIIGAALIGEWTEGAIVVLLFALSEALESYSVDKARQSIKTLMDIAPNEATIRRGNELISLHVSAIRVGDIMVIKPGEKIAMDGEVVSGQTSINQAAITGESLPVHKANGDEVFAGTINEEGAIEVRVTKLAEDTTLAKIIHLVEEAQAEKAPAQHFVDTFAKYYTPAIMILALLVAVVPPLLTGALWADWIYLGLATLVVGCPCALIISTPVAIVTAIGNAARHGVLIKGGAYLEETGRLDAIAFDKTGTLTNGTPEVDQIIAVAEKNEQDVLQIAAAVEAYSQHPIASAILREQERLNLDSIPAEAFQSITGKGAKATVQGKTYWIGNEALFDGITEMDEPVQQQFYQLQQLGNTVMLLGNSDGIIGIIAVKDQVRSTTKEVLQKLKTLGIKQTIMLTGDNHDTAEAIAADIGMTEVRADLLPEDKLDMMDELKISHRHVAMVGDGINDAPALAKASVGIAMGGAGTDAALETADVALMEDDLRKLPYTIGLSRRALNVIKQNISFALVLKVIALLLVIPGWLTLWIAIIADVGATLVVVLNSMRLMKVKE